MAVGCEGSWARARRGRRKHCNRRRLQARGSTHQLCTPKLSLGGLVLGPNAAACQSSSALHQENSSTQLEQTAAASSTGGGGGGRGGGSGGGGGRRWLIACTCAIDLLSTPPAAPCPRSCRGFCPLFSCRLPCVCQAPMGLSADFTLLRRAVPGGERVWVASITACRT